MGVRTSIETKIIVYFSHIAETDKRTGERMYRIVQDIARREGLTGRKARGKLTEQCTTTDWIPEYGRE